LLASCRCASRESSTAQRWLLVPSTAQHWLLTAQYVKSNDLSASGRCDGRQTAAAAQEAINSRRSCWCSESSTAADGNERNKERSVFVSNAGAERRVQHSTGSLHRPRYLAPLSTPNPLPQQLFLPTESSPANSYRISSALPTSTALILSEGRAGFSSYKGRNQWKSISAEVRSEPTRPPETVERQEPVE
jgi:hypothetical protein